MAARDLLAARSAFLAGDAERSRAAHTVGTEGTAPPMEPGHEECVTPPPPHTLPLA